MKILIPSVLLALGAGSSLVYAAAELAETDKRCEKTDPRCQQKVQTAPAVPDCPPAPCSEAPTAPAAPIPARPPAPGSVVRAPAAPRAAAAPSTVAWSVAPQEASAPKGAPCCPLGRAGAGLAELDRAVSELDLSALEVDLDELLERALALHGGPDSTGSAQLLSERAQLLARHVAQHAGGRAASGGAPSATSPAQSELDQRVRELERLLAAGEEREHGNGAEWARELEALESLGSLEALEGLGELEALEALEGLELFGDGPWTWTVPGDGWQEHPHGELHGGHGTGLFEESAPGGLTFPVPDGRWFQGDGTLRGYAVTPAEGEELRALVRDLRGEVEQLRAALRELRAEMKHLSAAGGR